MKKITITIGIPAYNEEANIKHLLQNLLAQKLKNIILEKIIVISDASTDKTVQYTKSLKHPQIEIIENKERRGKPAIQNTMFQKSISDVLIIIDADVLPLTKTFPEKLIEPIRKNNTIGIVGADTQPTKPQTFIEKVIADSHLFKTKMYEKINNGNTIYLCHGRARAFAKPFYKQLAIPVECSQEDAYTYLTCLKKGFTFAFAKQAAILFASPTTLLDHAKQSARFHQGKQGLVKDNFDRNTIQKAYAIPLPLLFKSFFFFFLRQPISSLSYLFIQGYLRFFNPIKKAHKGAWYISTSTKVIKI